MYKNTRLFTVLGIFLAILILALLVIVSAYRTEKASPLAATMAEYRQGTESWSRPQDLSYQDGGAEDVFLQGMDAFTAGNYEEAESLFYKSLTLKREDPALPVYAYSRTVEGDFYGNRPTAKTFGNLPSPFGVEH